MRPTFEAAALLCLLAGLSACGGSSAGPRATAPLSPRARALLDELPDVYRTADVANGAAAFGICRSCHTIAPGAPNMVGPNLWGVFGRPAAHLASYSYSAALKARGGIWDAATLNAWLTAPAAYAPGTKMSYPGLKDPNERRDVIAYLKLASAGAAPSP